jgi:hypothetical protein
VTSPIAPPTTAAVRRTSGIRRRLRSPKTIYLLIAFLLFVAAGLACIPRLRSEKLRLAILRNQIEQSAAPDEPIAIDNWLLYRALAWKGSPGLRRQLIDARGIAAGGIALEQSHGEMILVVPDGDSLPATLRSEGFVLTANASQARTLAAGRGFHIPGKGLFRIYFVTRPRSAPASSPTEGTAP